MIQKQDEASFTPGPSPTEGRGVSGLRSKPSAWLVSSLNCSLALTVGRHCRQDAQSKTGHLFENGKATLISPHYNAHISRQDLA